ncbi:MAG: glycosyltransferase [Methylococcaceae bacterium]
MNVCFITNELHPFKPGGIGRLLYNFAVQNRDRGNGRCNFFFLVSSTDVPDTDSLEEYFAEHDLGTVVATPKTFSFLGEYENRLFEAIAQGHSGPGRVRTSIEYYNGLLYLEAKYGIKLDLIEFPDFAAWGFAALNAKRAGLAFANARIVVRLHSTQGIIYDAEPFYHPKGLGERSMMELERQCVEQADMLVSHLPVITQANQKYYAFGQAWSDKVVHEFPPIFLEDEEIFAVNADAKTQNFIFSSRIQPFKRPDLFIKAAALFLDRQAEFQGKFYMVSYGWDERYISWLKGLIPQRHSKKVLFIFNAEANLRNRLLQESIVVVPSNYESLCVFAYESALRGSKLILNRQCLAFGEVDYWREGENCLQFDGTAEDLACVYEQALAAPAPVIKPLPESLCFWHKPDLPPLVTAANKTDGKLAVIGYGFTSLAQVNERLFELASLLNDGRFELHLILNVSYKQAVAIKLPQTVKLHYCAWDIPNPGYIKSLLTGLDADYLAFSPPDGQVAAEFYSLARNALDRHADLSIVTSQVRMFKEEELKNSLWQEGNRDDYGVDGKAKISIGGAPSLVGLDMNIVSQYSCLRLSEVDLAKIHEESADFFLPLLLNGAIAKKAGTLVIPKLLITEYPNQKAFLNETAVLHALAL